MRRQLNYYCLWALLLALGACTAPFKNIEKRTTYSTNKTQFLAPLQADVKSYLFNAAIQFGQRDFSGLMIIKPLGEQHFRGALTAKAGPNVLDFEWKEGAFQIHDCIPPLRKKMVFKWLENNVPLLLQNFESVANTELYLHQATQDSVYRFKAAKSWLFYHYQKMEMQSVLKKIVRASRHRQKNVLELTDYQNDFPNKITIRHPNTQLRMELNLLTIKGLGKK